jgi:osmotically-inducible protein OsmY
MTVSEDNPQQLVRADNGILAAIWDALQNDAGIPSLDLGGLSISEQNGEIYLDGYLKEKNQPLLESIVNSVVGVVEVHNRLISEDGILASIWDGLRREDAICTLDLGSLSIVVKDGEVYLDGHLAQKNSRSLIENSVRSAAGVAAVHNCLVVDSDLVLEVAQALAKDERTRRFVLPVYASHGWISLGGEVPTRSLQHAAEEVAGCVSCVRGVIALPRVTGESPALPRHAVQPRTGAVVYHENGEEGIVSYVVIHPDNRLVTHIVVRTNELRDIHLVKRENTIPVGDCHLANPDCAFIGRNRPSIHDFPPFDPGEYPLAPFTWKAPSPYTAGEIRWSLRQILKAGSRSGSRPAGEFDAVAEKAPDRGMVHAMA